ncbi:MAG: P1 family peptidase [Chloroflexota bacterium]|nr:P1 family peptidase [Chloroflexota bacterium]MDE2931907.1 P1 family peptidase [Chloroflexota bacterium]
MSDRNPNKPPLSNDSLDLIPTTEFRGPRLTFDFPDLEIGIAEYAEGPTGCTVFAFGHSAVAAVDIRGGAHATLYTEPLQNGEGKLDAICLAGGSFYGLEAAAGVAAELLAQRAYSPHWGNIALVSGAIIYDYGPRANAVYPDKALGRAALKAARPGVFPLGPRGAGRSATVGKWLQKPYRSERAGQGGAFREAEGVKVAVFTVVNAVGAILNRHSRVVRGSLDPRTGERPRVADAGLPAPPPPGNTTLTVVVTNQILGGWSLRQLARHVHTSMARAIEPLHTISDGDVLYAVTTNAIPQAEGLNEYVLSALASETAWDAVLASFGDEESPRAGESDPY